ncbi:unnamed protein product [Parnassius mnemosyne]|uniref:Uncharacterized protein n=1 Tax=Parnassius mnemosyne TaxID=213953 RepID=A0AAV1KV44_9NEOP
MARKKVSGARDAGPRDRGTEARAPSCGVRCAASGGRGGGGGGVSQIARDAAGAALSRGHVPGAAARRS